VQRSRTKHLVMPVVGIALAIALLAAMLLVLFSDGPSPLNKKKNKRANNAENDDHGAAGDSLWTMAQARHPDPAHSGCPEAEPHYARIKTGSDPDPHDPGWPRVLVPPVQPKPATGEVGASSQPVSPQPAALPEPTTAQPEEIPRFCADSVEEPPTGRASRSCPKRKEITRNRSSRIHEHFCPFPTLRHRASEDLGIGIIPGDPRPSPPLIAWRLPQTERSRILLLGLYGGSRCRGEPTKTTTLLQLRLSEQPVSHEREGTSVGDQNG